MKFGDHILRVREKQGRTQKDIAEAAGLSPQYVNDIERNRREPSERAICGLAKGLAVPTDLVYVWAGRLPPDLRDLDEWEAHALDNAIRQFRLSMAYE